MTGVDLFDAQWRKSIRSNDQGACVEVAFVPGGVAARDSKAPHGAVLRFDHAQWSSFLASLKR